MKEGVLTNADKISNKLLNIFIEDREMLEVWQCLSQKRQDKILNDVKWVIADSMMIAAKTAHDRAKNK